MSTTPNGSNGADRGGYLEFERPLAKIERQIEELEASQATSGRDHSAMIRTVRAELLAARRKLYSRLDAWEVVQMARHPKRPLVPDYIDMMVRDFCELHGDKGYRDDKAIITGFGRIGNFKCMLVGHNKGKDTKERLENCFGMAHPEGYRKALAKMRLAEKFNLPIIALIDTAGAYPGIGAEERGIAHAIAVNLQEMSRLRVPILCVVIGEGGSGGALGIGVGDRVAMLEHAYYSVISPEGCAAILWKSAEFASTAAKALKFTARDLKRLRLIDEIIKEPLGGAHRDPAATAASVERFIVDTLRELKRTRIETIVRRRYKKWRDIGAYFTSGKPAQAASGAKSPAGGRRSKQVGPTPQEAAAAHRVKEVERVPEPAAEPAVPQPAATSAAEAITTGAT
ncbi:MAG TPA: acetyl-CoA carboxylase carboxyltransferase subunit alpha [Phycisphaerae bacterium]|nr:acetyl-CoA carboxylase carboxyltransferase subunit alpha [Phycisphaerae bacterium]